MDSLLAQLKLIHLADSAAPIGAAAHSFGLETLAAEGELDVERLAAFLRDYLEEAAMLDGGACRLAYRLAASEPGRSWEGGVETQWIRLNQHVSALKLARESRSASATLGRRLLQLLGRLERSPRLEMALRAGMGGCDLHHAPAFGLAGGLLGVEEELTVAMFLQGLVAAMVSACQRLLPLGQTRAAELWWNLKPAILDAAAVSRRQDWSEEDLGGFSPLLEYGSMRHPVLPTRLFIS